jgi:hypothetical protein
MEEKEQKRKGDVYRELKVGAVFRAERGRERSELAPGRLGWIGLKLVVCAMWRGVQLRAALGHCSIVWLCKVDSERPNKWSEWRDGAPWIWKLVCEQFPGAVQIVDLYHAQQHVWEVAHAVFGPEPPTGHELGEASLYAARSRAGRELVTAIAALPKIPPEPNESRSAPEKALDYFTTNAERMRYPSFRAEAHACRQWHR